MDGLKHTCGFVLQFLVHLLKEQCESEPHQTKKTLYLVRTKASELADFSGVNIPQVSQLCAQWAGHMLMFHIDVKQGLVLKTTRFNDSESTLSFERR